MKTPSQPMRIFSKSFISAYYNDGPSNTYGPERIRQKAIMFANKVYRNGFLISMTETSTKWGDSVTVWYEAINEVEV